LRAVNSFYCYGRWPRGWNTSFMSLIPKVDNPQGFNMYRPISLVGSIYKNISKLLAKRMKLVLHKVTDGKQSAFFQRAFRFYSGGKWNNRWNEKEKERVCDS